MYVCTCTEYVSRKIISSIFDIRFILVRYKISHPTSGTFALFGNNCFALCIYRNMDITVHVKEKWRVLCCGSAWRFFDKSKDANSNTETLIIDTYHKQQLFLTFGCC